MIQQGELLKSNGVILSFEMRWPKKVFLIYKSDTLMLEGSDFATMSAMFDIVVWGTLMVH